MTESTLTVIQLAGGVGLFLLGMIVMTEGLRAVAGDAMRHALMRFTRNPLSGAVAGATTTALLQSSSAMTVAAVGFVSVGLMSFSNALGIIFGANIGTTITGWLVVLVGFKLSLGMLALPLVFLGAILRLFAKDRVASAGFALAGFGLLFVGIGTMQQAMIGLDAWIRPDVLPGDTLSGRLQLVALGIITTIIIQSSSAGVAATLTALFAGSINFEQAAALVIGMDVGTTLTAAMATIGRSVEARRTGFSHVFYNLFIGSIALFLINPYMQIWEWLLPGGLSEFSGIALVAFHTSFNTLGVMIVLPFTHRYAAFMETLIPARGPSYARTLDLALTQQPQLALAALQTTLSSQLQALLGHVNAILGDRKKGGDIDLVAMQSSLDGSRLFMDRVHLEAGSGADWERLIALIHALDHMQRLHERCSEESDRARTARISPELAEQKKLLTDNIEEVIANVEEGRWLEASQVASAVSAQIDEQVEPLRERIMRGIATGEIYPRDGTDCLKAIRWLHRVGVHVSRITRRFAQSFLAAAK